MRGSAGYVEIGRRCRFAYPWPVVAILGIEQVHRQGMRQNRVYGLVGEAARRMGWRGLADLIDGSEDVLRRTNRGIFADSCRRCCWRLRADELRRAGEGDARGGARRRAAAADVRRGVPRARSRALRRARHRRAAARFAALSRLTVRHFAREQAVFTHQIGPPPSRPQRWPLAAAARAFARCRRRSSTGRA